MKFYRCEGCGKIIGMVKPSKCPTKCCGEPMVEMVPNTTDAAVEKHVPVYTVEGNVVTVCVGEAEHPMLDAHYIQWIAVETNKGVQFKYLKPGETPVAEFVLAEGEAAVAAYEYCNLHGLWKAEV